MIWLLEAYRLKRATHRFHGALKTNRSQIRANSDLKYTQHISSGMIGLVTEKWEIKPAAPDR